MEAEADSTAVAEVDFTGEAEVDSAEAAPSEAAGHLAGRLAAGADFHRVVLAAACMEAAEDSRRAAIAAPHIEVLGSVGDQVLDLARDQARG